MVFKATSSANYPASEFPNQGSNLGRLHWECEVLAAGPQGSPEDGVLKAWPHS